MVPIELFLVKTKTTRWNNDATSELIFKERIYSLFFLFNESTPLHQIIVDTGAPLTVLPQAVWKKHSGAIEWLSCEEPETPPGFLSVNGIGGGSIPCQIGVVDMALVGKDGKILRRRVVAKCTQDEGTMRAPLLGLGGRTFDGSKLELRYVDKAVWIFGE